MTRGLIRRPDNRFSSRHDATLLIIWLRCELVGTNQQKFEFYGSCSKSEIVVAIIGLLFQLCHILSKKVDMISKGQKIHEFGFGEFSQTNSPYHVIEEANNDEAKP